MKIPTLIKKSGAARCLLLCLAFGAAMPTFGGTYYVAKTGANAANRNGSTTQPWATITYALSRISDNAGNTIIVRDGTYYEGVVINKNGSSDTSRLVIKAQNKRGAIVDAEYTRKYGFLFGGNPNNPGSTGNYVTVDGFQVRNSIEAGINMAMVHHVTVTNCESYDNWGAGIRAGESDYIKIDDNEVYNCAWGWTSKAPGIDTIVTSGISVLHCKAYTSGNATQARVFVRRNMVYYNYQNEYKRFAGTNQPDPSKPMHRTDGGGIILDDLRCKQTLGGSDPLPLYEYPAVVEDNLVLFNGGSGIKLFSTANIKCRNNTCFKNNRDDRSGGWQAEFQVINCDNVDLVNNIGVYDTAWPANDGNARWPASSASDLAHNAIVNVTQETSKYDPLNPKNTNIAWKNNLFYNYDGAVAWTVTDADAQLPNNTSTNSSGNMLTNTPGFTSLSNWQFWLTGSSACLNTGIVWSSTTLANIPFGTSDIDGLPRQVGTIDRGCYEKQ